MRTKVENKEGNRPKRTPINGRRNILNVEGIPEDLHACWVNDYNVQRFLDGGYEFWYDDKQVGDNKVDSDSRMGAKVSKNVGNGVTAFLMVVPKEIFNEEMEQLHKDIDDKEAIMFRSQKQADGRYGNISVEHGSKK